MMSRDFLARMESLKIEIKPDIMKEVNQQLDLWPPDRSLAYISEMTQLVIDRAGPYYQRAIDRMDAGEKPDLIDKRIGEAASLFALAMLRVYQAKALEAAQSEDDQAQA